MAEHTPIDSPVKTLPDTPSKMWVNLKLITKATNILSLSHLFDLITPVVFAFIGSLLEGATLFLLIPTCEVILSGSINSQFIEKLPSILAKWMQDLSLQGRGPLLSILISATLLASIGRLTLGYFASVGTVQLTKSFTHSLREALFKRYLSFGKLFFDRSSVGVHQQVITTYINSISNALTTFQTTLSALFTLIIYLGMLFALSWKLTLIVVGIFPLLHWMLTKLIHRVSESSRAYASAYDNIGRRLSNSLSTIPLVKSYTNEHEELKTFSNLSAKLAEHDCQTERRSLIVSPLQELALLLLLIGLVFVMAAIEPSTDSASLASKVVFILILKRATTIISMLNIIRTAFAGVSGFIEEIASLLRDDEKFFVSCGTEKFSELQSALEFRNLTFEYRPGYPILNNVTFAIQALKTTAIVGESGSGKSTIVHLLMRFYDPSSHTILCDGKDLRSFTFESWLSHVALVSQETLLFNDTLKNNIIYGLKNQVSDDELFDALKKARLLKLVDGLPHGLETVIGDRGLQLSGGEKQRVSIARAILKKADILLLDEATSALDSVTEHGIQEALDALSEGKTTIIVAHRLSTIRKADHVIVLEKGSVIEEGTLTGLLSHKGRFHNFWQQQGLSE